MSLRRTLLWLCSGLLLLPFLGYHYLQDMQQFLLRGQENAQQLTAQAVATLLQQRDDLLASSPLPADEEALYAWPTDQYMVLDGYDDDWDPRIRPIAIPPQRGADGNAGFAMRIRLAQRGATLWLMVQVDDPTRVFRHPAIAALDSSDHLRLALRYGGAAQRLVIAAEAIGLAEVYAADRFWRHPVGPVKVPLQANWQEREGGYQVEIELPLAALAEDPRVWLAAVDVDNSVARTPGAVLASGSHRGRAVHLHAPELQRLIAGLRQSGRHIRVLDRQAVVRAVSNFHSATPGLEQRASESVHKALAGSSVIDRYRSAGQERILAAEPIRGAGDAVIGVVLVEVATREILDLQRTTLVKTAALTAAVFGLIMLGLLWFGARLTRRIRQLGSATRKSLDERGRVVSPLLPEAQRGSDELGQLGTEISTLLGRLQHYTSYLERMPRALRHELSNPLNTIGTSLQMLRDSSLGDHERRYIDSAERGVERLTLILTALAEATSLEEALQEERLEPVELSGLVRRYMLDHRDQYRRHRLVLGGLPQEAWTQANPLRLEQALDKLLDNAADFAPAGSEVTLNLEPGADSWQLSLFNQGAPIPEGLQSSLFESLVTGRGGQATDCPHLGMGLYVVRLIIESAGGTVAASNRDNGVAVALALPRILSP
ncbi:ATP-binding protein [Motiliproteus sediminis]|uniref:ATP-binding protein n=1 Tax=Motiliproteus sediminis TaxID=1468178 RepID=UPI001AEF8734|nr:ATP-binding protein [Motiliproteus sediminis]